MSKVKNVSGEDRLVPWLNRLVMAGQVVEVESGQVWAFTQQESAWAPADDEAQKIHDENNPEKLAAKSASTRPMPVSYLGYPAPGRTIPL